tara:strand:+ start:906 stop:1109 length:204 start_codon:yes stop_codon:yes gene_type:complete
MNIHSKNVHLNPEEVRLIYNVLETLRSNNPEFKKLWDKNKTTKKLYGRIHNAWKNDFVAEVMHKEVI